MDKYDFWTNLFATNKRLVIALIEIIGGLITRESYYLLKTPHVSKFRQFLARAVITLFLCLLLNGYLSELSPKYHFLLLGILAISCVPILDWFLKSFLPGALTAMKAFAIKWLIGLADQAKKQNKDLTEKKDD